MAQKHAEKAIQTLALCLDDETATWPARVFCRELLDRLAGRRTAQSTTSSISARHSRLSCVSWVIGERAASQRCRSSTTRTMLSWNDRSANSDHQSNSLGVASASTCVQSSNDGLLAGSQ
jgi:hypothetical protein